MGAAADTARDLDEVELHRLAVGVGHGERRAGAARRADGAEQVGAFVALIGGLAWARAAPRPLPHEAVLLADAGFVLEPDLDRLAFRQAGAVSVQRRGEVFLKAATVSSSLAGWRGRALTCEKPSSPPRKNGWEEEDKYGDGAVTDSPGSARPFSEPRRQRKEEWCEEEEVHDASEYIERGHRRAPSHVNLKFAA